MLQKKNHLPPCSQSCNLTLYCQVLPPSIRGLCLGVGYIANFRRLVKFDSILRFRLSITIGLPYYIGRPIINHSVIVDFITMPLLLIRLCFYKQMIFFTSCNVEDIMIGIMVGRQTGLNVKSIPTSKGFLRQNCNICNSK